MEKLEAQEAAKWEEGSRKANSKKITEEQKKQEKLKAKKEREELLAAEEERIAKEAKGKRQM